MRPSLIVLSLLSLLACEGPAGPQGAAGAQGDAGPAGDNGEDGENGEDGAAGSAFASGTLAPGEHLSLEHDLGSGDMVYQAQFEWSGTIYDHSAYPMLLPAHFPSAWALENDDFESYTDELAGDRLASGDYVLFNQGYLELEGEDAFAGVVVDSSGAVVQDLPDYRDSSEAYFYGANVAATEDGGFAVVLTKEIDGGGGWRDIAQIDRYNATGTLVGTEDFAPSSVGIEQVTAESLPGGGFVVGFSGYNEDLEETVAGLRFYDASGNGTSVAVSAVDSNYVRIAVLSDGRVALLVERSVPGGSYDSTDVLIVSPDGTIDSETRVHDGYITDDSAIVYGSRGTLLVTAESGGPDLPYYAVLDTDGAIIQPATGMSGWENTMIEAAAFPDGDFLVVVTEDDSLAPMTWVVGAQGGLLRPMVVGDVSSVPDYDRGLFLPTGDGHTVGHIDPSYDSDLAPRFTAYTKGLLQIRVEGEGEVRLYNQTPSTLDVTLAAHRAP